MKCPNCGGDLQENDIYCGKCGTKIKDVDNKISNKVPVISWVSLGFLIVGVVSFILGGILDSADYYNEILEHILYFPYVFVSLIISIIGRVLNKDKLSLIVLIIDAVLIILFVIFSVIMVLFFVSAINSLVEGCSYH